MSAGRPRVRMSESDRCESWAFEPGGRGVLLSDKRSSCETSPTRMLEWSTKTWTGRFEPVFAAGAFCAAPCRASRSSLSDLGTPSSR